MEKQSNQRKHKTFRVIIVDESTGDQIYNEQATAIVGAIAITRKEHKDDTCVSGLCIADCPSSTMAGVVMTLNQVRRDILNRDPSLVLKAAIASIFTEKVEG